MTKPKTPKAATKKAKSKPVTTAKPRKSRRIDPDKNQQGLGGGRPLTVFDDKMTSEVERLAAMLTVAQMGDFFGCGETTIAIPDLIYLAPKSDADWLVFPWENKRQAEEECRAYHLSRQ